MDVPRFPNTLFHYTSRETFQKIVRTQTIRFTRLDQVNDADDGVAKDLPNAATALFVSCWTSQVSESLPMWSLYSGRMDGVRLAFSPDWLSGKYQRTPYSWTRVDKILHVNRRGGFDMGTVEVWGPEQMSYTDHPSRVPPAVTRRTTQRLAYNIRHLGLIKRKHWSFEREWRYRLSTIPVALSSTSEVNRIWLTEVIDFVQYPVEETYIDVPIAPNTWNRAHILLGPKVSEGAAGEVESILHKHSIDVKVARSSIKIR